jgi:predicted ATP-dependent endonuclease of OLD family
MQTVLAAERKGLPMTIFKRLEISKWQQFGEIAIDFDRPVTILTGANASGKTTLLSLLSQHSSWNFPSLSVPFRDKISEVFRWMSHIFRNIEVTDAAIGNDVVTLRTNNLLINWLPGLDSNQRPTD